MAKYDVIIVGGGIIGAALADELASRRKRVCLIERDTIGSEASKAAAGILSAQMDVDQPGPFFDFCQASRRLYPSWVRRLERVSRLRVDYHEDGILSVALTRADVRDMQQRCRWQRRFGYQAQEWSAAHTRKHEPHVNRRILAGFFFPTEAQLDNVRLLDALAVTCRKNGVAVREHTEALRVLTRHGHVTGVHTDHGTHHAPVVVNCLGSWSSLNDTLTLKPPVVPAKGQMFGFQAPKGFLRHVLMSPIAYGVQRRSGYLVVGSTVEFVGFHKQLTLNGMQRILSGFSQLVEPSLLDQCTFVESWVGLRPCSHDRLPILGTTAIEGLYVATAHFRHGILLAPITAKVMSELILTGRSSFPLHSFSISRFAKS